MHLDEALVLAKCDNRNALRRADGEIMKNPAVRGELSIFAAHRVQTLRQPTTGFRVTAFAERQKIFLRNPVGQPELPRRVTDPLAGNHLSLRIVINDPE